MSKHTRGLIWGLCSMLVFHQGAWGQPGPVQVFAAGTDGYSSYRIPAIIRLPGQRLLAFAEGRVAGSADFGDVDIVLKTSADLGRTWSPLQVVVDRDTLQAGNPAPVLDLTDPAYPQGRVLLFFNTGNRPEGDIRRGMGRRRVWFTASADGGRSWSDPVEITAAVKLPGWRTYANTPGHALQFNDGPYRGRLYVAANHSDGDPRAEAGDYRAHGFYSDDHGRSFHLSQTVELPGSNEATAAPLDNGRLMMNIRNQAGRPRCRIVALSGDGGVHWDTAYYDRQLPDPVCEGSLLRLPGRGRTMLAFCNNADTLHRRRLTVRISRDGGRHWHRAYALEADSVSTAYADMVSTGRRRLGVLYERDDYKEIVFASLRWKP